MFKPVDPKPDFPAMERAILNTWKETDAFKKLVRKNRGNPRWSFIDGPITANNPMGVHHAWGRMYKDLYQRYHAMLGFDQRYQNGFDGQGLWIEVEVEKELGFKSKRDIETYGIDRFVEKCMDRVRHYSAIQTEQSIRLGYWMDWDNSYQTMSDENNYTIWLFLKRCHERGLLYKGLDSMPWCPRCSTGLSNMEIVTEGYKELTHTSIYLKFPIIERPGESLLVWTTTPWTLAANVAAAVHPELTYLRIQQGNETLYVSKGALKNAIRGQYEVLGEVTGQDLAGLTYGGPFDELPIQEGIVHRVILWDEVSDTEGTGIVHIAPGCGKEDFALSKEFGLAVIAPIDEFGNYLPNYDWLSGQNAAAVVKPIVDNLTTKKVLYRTQQYTHRYPTCWRCGTELVFRVVDEWFISMDGARRDNAPDARPTLLRDEIAAITRQIRWIPDFGEDRELDWLKNMDDWMISKKRFYGLALPIYDCLECGNFDVMGSEIELRERAIEGWDAFDGHSPHRPWIDDVKIACSACGKPVSRITDVGNAWLDAGIVPFSTLGYRHNSEEWAKWFPADFITESFPGQFRNWFYSMLAQSTVLEGVPPFKVCFGFATLKDEKGEDMHKSKGNSIPFDDAAEKAGADVLRWMYARCNPTSNLLFGYGPASEVRRRLLTLWNVYSFFITYARIDGFDPTQHSINSVETSPLDRWVLAKLNKLIRTVRANLDDFDSMTACRDIEAFIDELSTWYLRRGRRRYWKSEGDADKTAAYCTLHYVLVTISKLIAPIQPFLAEELYQNLVRNVDEKAEESVHHTRYPEADPVLDDVDVAQAMDQVLQIVNLGRAARNKASLRVRQPLARVLVAGVDVDAIRGLESHILEELNVKRIESVDDASSIAAYEIKPVISLLGPKYGSRLREIQEAISRVDPALIARQVQSGQPVEIGDLQLLPSEIEVRTKDLAQLAAAAEGKIVVAIDTVLSPELVREGYARELVHRVQTMRKTADYQIEDRIDIFVETGSPIQHVFSEFDSYIRLETLAHRVTFGVPETTDLQETLVLNGESVALAIRRA